MMETQKLSVLVAEDDRFVRESLISLLEDLGYSVAGTARDGREAVALTCELKPDVVLMDMDMPEVNGLEAAQMIQERHPTPIVVLTAFENKVLVRAAGAAGVSAYLTKPAVPADIERAIIIARARHGDLMELRRLNAKLEAALKEIRTLEGFLPICSFCKKVRNDKGYWEQVEVYIRDRTPAKVSHGICPDCYEREYGRDSVPPEGK